MVKLKNEKNYSGSVFITAKKEEKGWITKEKTEKKGEGAGEKEGWRCC